MNVVTSQNLIALDYLQALQRFLLSPATKWGFLERANFKDKNETWDFGHEYSQMTHLFFSGVWSSSRQTISPLIEAVRAKFGIQGALSRAKANLNFNTAPGEGGYGCAHKDATSGIAVVFYPFAHESGTYFKFGDSLSVVPSEENSAVCFPANMLHGMVLPISTTPRFVINFVFEENHV